MLFFLIVVFVFVLCWLWRMSNCFSYGLLLKSSCVFLFMLQLLGFFYCWFLQNCSDAKTISCWYRTVCCMGYNYENLLQKTSLVHVLWVYLYSLSFFALGILTAIRNKHFLRHSLHFREDFLKNKLTYSRICATLSIMMLSYWIYLYYKIDLYPFKKSIWSFSTNRYVPLLYYPSIIHLISRTIPFIIFALCWQARGLIARALGCLCFFYGFCLIWKTSSLLTMVLLILGYLYIFYNNKIFKHKTIVVSVCCLFFAIICNFSVRKRGLFERVANTNIGDVLAIGYYKDNPQGCKFSSSFIKKGLGDRDQLTFAEEWNKILVNNKTNCSTGIGCIAASWVNFNWWGGGILFIFGYIVGCLEVFFATRKKFLIYWYSIYILLGFQIGNVFVISFFSSFVKGGIAVTCSLFILGLFLERFSNNETN